MIRRLLLASALVAWLPLAGHAQTAQELENGANDTANVLNYGMGVESWPSCIAGSRTHEVGIST